MHVFRGFAINVLSLSSLSARPPPEKTSHDRLLLTSVLKSGDFGTDLISVKCILLGSEKSAPLQ